ncbi:hypothetical protein [Streptomyces goshikiensis]|uniref:hypothetical protein n=1 Tax=Streptomyces goshikiensis TaxID=1942 RepID=UPI0036B5D2E3
MPVSRNSPTVPRACASSSPSARSRPAAVDSSPARYAATAASVSRASAARARSV